MARAKKKPEQKSKGFEPKARNRDSFAKHNRTINNITARQVVGTACHKSELLTKSYMKHHSALRNAAVMISGSHFERARASEALKKLNIG